MSENRPNLRRRMGSFVAKPEPGEQLFLHKCILKFCHDQYNHLYYCIHKMQQNVLHDEAQKGHMNQVGDISRKIYRL